MEDEDDYLDDALCQQLEADSAEDLPDGSGHFASAAFSSKSGQNPQLYKGKLCTFLKVRPECLLFVFLVSVFPCSFIFLL